MPPVELSRAPQIAYYATQWPASRLGGAANPPTSMGSSLRLLSGNLPAADDYPIATNSAMIESSQQGWDESLNELIDWWKTAGEVDEDGLQSPTHDAIRSASSILYDLRKIGGPSPSRVVMVGEGGIAIELVPGEFTARIEIDACGSAEFIIFKKHHILVRQPLGD